MSSFKFAHNVGRIAICDVECFWIFPRVCIHDTEHYMCSPWFSYMGEKWQFVMTMSVRMMNLYLWRKFCRVLPNDKYTVELKLSEEHIPLSFYLHNNLPRGYCEGHFNSHYGFQALRFLDTRHLLTNETHSGLIKIYFVIKQKYNVVDAPLSNLDEKNTNDEMSNEDEITSDDEDNEKKKVTFEDKGMKLLTENLKQIFLDGRMSDAVLKVDGREFNVHKVILVARSPVFESMFEHDMAEKDSNAVDIPDCTAESFEVFLHYLYTGRAETMSTSNVYNVYYAADKYHVDDLKEKCVKFMINNISVETFCDVIALSLRHEESKLQKAATDFFCKNIKKIIKTVGWQKYLDENSTQANELLIKALNA